MLLYYCTHLAECVSSCEVVYNILYFVHSVNMYFVQSYVIIFIYFVQCYLRR